MRFNWSILLKNLYLVNYQTLDCFFWYHVLHVIERCLKSVKLKTESARYACKDGTKVETKDGPGIVVGHWYMFAAVRLDANGDVKRLSIRKCRDVIDERRELVAPVMVKC